MGKRVALLGDSSRVPGAALRPTTPQEVPPPVREQESSRGPLLGSLPLCLKRPYTSGSLVPGTSLGSPRRPAPPSFFTFPTRGSCV